MQNVVNAYVFTIINELKFIPEMLRKKDEINPAKVIAQLEKSGAKKIDVVFPLYKFENLFTEMECNAIIELQKNDNKRSTVGSSTGAKVDEKRLSFSTYFELVEPELVPEIIQQVKKKILSVMSIPAQYSESIQGQWYQENGFYNDHYDAHHDYHQFVGHQGNRTWTCMVTLNEVVEGGGTYFPKLDVSFTPKIGQALIWYNLDENGLANPLTLHTGQLIKKGEKFIITQWFHQCTNG